MGSVEDDADDAPPLGLVGGFTPLERLELLERDLHRPREVAALARGQVVEAVFENYRGVGNLPSR